MVSFLVGFLPTKNDSEALNIAYLRKRRGEFNEIFLFYRFFFNNFVPKFSYNSGILHLYSPQHGGHININKFLTTYSLLEPNLLQGFAFKQRCLNSIPTLKTTFLSAYSCLTPVFCINLKTRNFYLFHTTFTSLVVS